MTMDEILVFKQFDSKVFGGGGGDNNEENGGRFCFHTSFSLLSPNGNHHHQHHQLVEKDQQLQNQHIPRGRQSIEVRALILY